MSEFVKDIENYHSDPDQNMSVYLGQEYFSPGETAKMAEVTVTTNEPAIVDGDAVNAPKNVENKKLYLPNSKDEKTVESTIYVGSGNDIPLVEESLVDFEQCEFWLRSPAYEQVTDARTFKPPKAEWDHWLVDSKHAHVGQYEASFVPAFHLDLSTVGFASAAQAASSTYKGYQAIPNTDANVYTLRYTSDGTERAVIDTDSGQTKIQVTNASGKYLMVQDSRGVYAKEITADTELVTAGEIQMGNTEADKLSDFNNCKVWIESTDADRITTAKPAERASLKAKLLRITAPEEMTVANGTAYADMGLPSQVDIVTEGNAVTKADVTWNTTTPVSGSYDPSVKTKQTVTLRGTVTCPEAIDPNGVELTTTITVTIRAEESADEPTENPSQGEQPSQGGKPSQTEQPSQTGKAPQSTATSDAKSKAPKTGDAAPITWLFLIAAISGAGVACLGRKKKRNPFE